MCYGEKKYYNVCCSGFLKQKTVECFRIDVSTPSTPISSISSTHIIAISSQRKDKHTPKNAIDRYKAERHSRSHREPIPMQQTACAWVLRSIVIRVCWMRSDCAHAHTYRSFHCYIDCLLNYIRWNRCKVETVLVVSDQMLVMRPVYLWFKM